MADYADAIPSYGLHAALDEAKIPGERFVVPRPGQAVEI